MQVVLYVEVLFDPGAKFEQWNAMDDLAMSIVWFAFPCVMLLNEDLCGVDRYFQIYEGKKSI